MSVIASSTVSTVPAATAAFNSSSVTLRKVLQIVCRAIRSGIMTSDGG
jgi:hypothetical protein